MRRGTHTVVAGDIVGGGLARDFADKARSVRQLLKRIEKGVQKEERGFKKEPTNWGYLGDLGHVESELKDIASFLQV